MANWDDLRLLLAVSQRGSLLGAAQELGLSVSTVSRRLSKFEAHLGSPVVERHVEGCRVTSRGQRLVALATRMASDLERERLTAHAAELPLSGTLRVTSGDGFVPYLIKVAGAFMGQNPGVHLEYVVEQAYRDVARGDVDVAVRVAHHGEPSLIYKRVAEISYGVFCAASYADLCPRNPTPEDVDYIALLPPLSEEAHMKAARTSGFVNAKLRLSTFQAQLSAVQAGLGAGLLPTVMAPGLINLFPQLAFPKLAVYVVTRPQALKQPHIRGFVDHLYAGLSAPDAPLERDRSVRS